MDKARFYANLRASKVPLHPLRIDGWDGVIYLRAQTVGEINAYLLKGAQGQPETQPQPGADPYFIARSLARIVRGEDGALLFDADDDAQMAELMAELAETAPAISKQINDAYKALTAPTSAEVGPEGN